MNTELIRSKESVPQQGGQMQNINRFNFFDPVQFDTMQRVCKLFASSELVPDMYRESKTNPIDKAMANCMIALEIADRIGASPLMVMQNMVPIYGRPSWSSKFLVATVNSCGRFNPLQYRFTEKGTLGMVEYTDYVYDPQTRSKRAVTKQFDGKKIQDVECVAFTTAKGSDKELVSSPVSLRMAIQEGWYTKNGSKWQTMSRQMLMYRAASFWTSAYAPELSMGMRTIEEQQDIIDVDYTEVPAGVEELVEAEKAQFANGETLEMPGSANGSANDDETCEAVGKGDAEDLNEDLTEDLTDGLTDKDLTKATADKSDQKSDKNKGSKVPF